MSLSIASHTPLPDVSHWARGSGLEIVLLVTGAILLTRLATWLGGKIMDRIDANARETDALVRSETSKHRHALASVITWTVLVVIYCVTGLAVLERLGIPLTTLVAPAAVAAVALGFGAQRVVQDLLAGFFIISERQYGYGDLVQLLVPGQNNPGIGTVEDVTLRVTTVRTADGEVVVTPNGQITQVTNLSRDWARAVIDVPVPVAVDVNRVSDLLRQIGDEAYKDDELSSLLLDPPAVMGVQSIDVDHFQVRVVARTLPGTQFDVGRMLRVRIAAGLLREGISVPTTLETARADRSELCGGCGTCSECGPPPGSCWASSWLPWSSTCCSGRSRRTPTPRGPLNPRRRVRLPRHSHRPRRRPARQPRTRAPRRGSAARPTPA